MREAPGAGGALRDPIILPICCERRAVWRINSEYKCLARGRYSTKWMIQMLHRRGIAPLRRGSTSRAGGSPCRVAEYGFGCETLRTPLRVGQYSPVWSRMDSTPRYCEMLHTYGYLMRLAGLGIQSRPGNDERQSGQLIARGLSPPCQRRKTKRPARKLPALIEGSHDRRRAALAERPKVR
ncbi:hypothetical protein HDV57DRAFT_223550 [Trichoderma longibrachiatum]|uniref:Uncharacterized protein n=1 Tax=Trichoderma longibrachiatum ATCC 18648 TaxID=983965 RepID=A0A2T4C7F4_TRILO|nr:hypothetical protein M440DRAFT_1214071 [Trichoderma longibrachiatum ATCC 18648]